MKTEPSDCTQNIGTIIDVQHSESVNELLENQSRHIAYTPNASQGGSRTSV